jgi:hypothetical protein
MEQVTIIISPSGGVEVAVSCVKGKKCSDVSKAIEQALGSKTKDTPTADMAKGVVHADHSR